MNKLLFNYKYRKFIKQYTELLQNRNYSSRYDKEVLKSEHGKMKIINVKIYDVLNNREVNKLIKSIYKLNSTRFVIDNTYKKPHLLSDYILVDMKINSSVTGIISRISLLDDNLVKSIEISYSQINSQQWIIEYNFHLKKFINYSEMKKVIINNIMFTKKCSIQGIYNINRLKNDTDIFRNIWRINDELLQTIFQSYIINNFFTNLGVTYKLPVLTLVDYSDCLSIENDLKESFLSYTFYNLNKEYYISYSFPDDYDGVSMVAYFKTKTIPNCSLLYYFTNYKNEFYFQLFYRIEEHVLDTKIGKYLRYRNKNIKQSDCKWIINKLRALRDSKFDDLNHFTFEDKWVRYLDGKETRDKFVYKDKLIKKYLKVYEEYFQYINTMVNVQNNYLALKISLIVLVVSIIGIVISLIA